MKEKKKEKTIKSPILKFIMNTIFPLVIAFLIGALIILLMGENPLNTYYQMISKSLFETTGLWRTFHVAAPLILTGLAIAVTFKANVFNMGVEGQAVLGGFSAAIAGSYLQISNPGLHILVCVTAAVVVGMIAALIPAVLKAYFNVNEIVVTLMLNYVIVELLMFLCEGTFKDPSPAGYVSTPKILSSAMINKIGFGDLTGFTFAAILLTVILLIIMKKTKLGYEIHAIGYNQEFAEATGVHVRKKIITLMLLSGALSGMAGAGWMLSEKFRYSVQFSGAPGLGWDGMLVALLGGNSPLGVAVAAIFYSALKVGMSKIELFTSVPKEIVSIIQALMVLLLAVKYYKKDFFKNKKIEINGKE